MSAMVGRILVLGAGAGVLFCAGLVGTLAARGKLNREYLGPMLGMAPDALHPMEGTDAAGAGLAEGAAAVRTAKPEPAPSKPMPPSVMPGLVLPSPFSSEETSQLFRDLHAMRDELALKSAKVESDRRDLEMLRAELNRRWDEIDRREQELEHEARMLTGERRELDQQSVVLREVELQNLKTLAEKFEKMPATAAAELLRQYEPDKAAKVLTMVKARESGKILAAMPPEFASKVAERMLGVTMQTGQTGQTGQSGQAGPNGAGATGKGQ